MIPITSEFVDIAPKSGNLISFQIPVYLFFWVFFFFGLCVRGEYFIRESGFENEAVEPVYLGSIQCHLLVQ